MQDEGEEGHGVSFFLFVAFETGVFEKKHGSSWGGRVRVRDERRICACSWFSQSSMRPYTGALVRFHTFQRIDPYPTSRHEPLI